MSNLQSRQESVRTLIVMLILICYARLPGQVDTLVVYDVRTRQVDVISPHQVDQGKDFDFTGWSLGESISSVQLSTEPPENPFPNAGFAPLVPAHSLFNISDYPICTSVKLLYYRNDSLQQLCSGTMVSANLVLTSAHCIYSYAYHPGSQTFADSVLAAPAYDAAMFHPLFGSSVSKKFYILKTCYDGEVIDDVALIELNEPLGLQTGWIGIAFNSDSDYFKDRVFHKLSYPGVAALDDSTKVYNGDTLYYSYGRLDLIEADFLGFNILGIPGQSGSSLFYTDNHVYYSFGTASWAGQSRHSRLDQGMFYAFGEVIASTTAGFSDDVATLPASLDLRQNYPNPFNQSTAIRFAVGNSGSIRLAVYNLSGQLTRVLMDEYKPEGEHLVYWDGLDGEGNTVASGIYVCVLKAQRNESVSRKMIMVK